MWGNIFSLDIFISNNIIEKSLNIYYKANYDLLSEIRIIIKASLQIYTFVERVQLKFSLYQDTHSYNIS